MAELAAPEVAQWEWIAPGEPFIPGERLTVYEGVMAFRHRCLDMPKPRSIADIEHWIGRPFEAEKPDPLSIISEEPPKSEAERDRLICWTVASELLGTIASGKMPTVPGWHGPPNPYAQLIRRGDFLRWAKSRGGYGEVVSELLARHKSQLQETGDGAPARYDDSPAALTEPSPPVSDPIEPLAEWVYAQHSPPTPLTFNALWDLAITKFEMVKKADFRKAYHRIYDTKPHRPPATGWPLQTPYRERWCEGHS